MPPQLALLGCVTAVLGLLLLDSRRQPKSSAMLWVPVAWLLILASRPVSIWLNADLSPSSGGMEEGSLVDRALLSVLMFVAGCVLIRRRVSVGTVIAQNKWIALFFLYCAVSILWSEFPAVALKRWIRAVGAVMMILVVLSEPQPLSAIATVVRRVAYVLVPTSVLLIKYYRPLGVQYDRWTGVPFLAGAAVDKNGLGRLCLVCGVFLLWDLTMPQVGRRSGLERMARAAGYLILLVTFGLLVRANSATSLGTFIAGTAVLFGLRLPLFRNRVRYLGTLVLAGGCLIAIDWSYLVQTAVTSLGRDMTFTTRTVIWNDLLRLGTNPWVGVGYSSFWLGPRLDELVSRFRITEAHNGYLEVYLELGLIGLCLVAAVVLSVFFRAKKCLTQDSTFDLGRLRMAMLTIFVLYNVTEAAYRATTLVFFMLLLVVLDVPLRRRSGLQQDAGGESKARLSPAAQPRLEGIAAMRGVRRGTAAWPPDSAACDRRPRQPSARPSRSVLAKVMEPVSVGRDKGPAS